MRNRLVTITCALLGLAVVAPNARAEIFNLQVTDTTTYVGLITPDVPPDPADELTYLQKLIALAPGASCASTDTSCAGATGQSYYRSGLTPVPDVGVSLPLISFSGGSWTADVAGTFYFVAKYDQLRAGGTVYLVDVDVNDVVNVPLLYGNKYGLSGVNAFSTISVPDSGTTVLLLGAGMLAIGIVRRRFAA